MTRARDRRPVSMNMTPMIDVVFLLIIFFLVSSHLAQQETRLELNLPTAQTGDEPVDAEVARITVNLLPDGTVLLGASEASLGELGRRLAHERKQADLPVEVRIRADQSIDFGRVKPVLVACAEAGVWDVTFAVTDQ